MAEKLSQDELWAKANKWAISYADMVTLLLTFFVLLLVILNEDEKIIEKEISKLLTETEQVLNQNIRSKYVGILREDKGVKITLRGKIFPSASDEVNSKFLPILESIGAVAINAPLFNIYSKDPANIQKRSTLIKRLRDKGDTLMVEIRVEGHTDDLKLPKGKRKEFKNNWELSSARSLSMVQLLAKMTGFPASRFSALGYGEFRPEQDIQFLKTKKDIKEARARNRRVEIYLDATVQKKKDSEITELEIDLK